MELKKQEIEPPTKHSRRVLTQALRDKGGVVRRASFEWVEPGQIFERAGRKYELMQNGSHKRRHDLES
jgi:hypothetical protein